MSAVQVEIEHTPAHLPPSVNAYKSGCRCWQCSDLYRLKERERYHYRKTVQAQTPNTGYTPHTPKSETEDWKLDAACHRSDVQFFHDKGESLDPAKRVCSTCRVRRECLEYALTEPRERWGVWGGTSGAERRTLRLPDVVGKPLPPVKLGGES